MITYYDDTNGRWCCLLKIAMPNGSRLMIYRADRTRDRAIGAARERLREIVSQGK